MERLTYRGKNGKFYVRADGYYQHCRMNIDSVAERLATYEDAEERGLLVRLSEDERKEFEKWKTERAKH